MVWSMQTNTLPAPKYNVNAVESALLTRFGTLRRQAFGLGGTLGADFATESAREWKDRGFTGLASACFNFSRTLAELPGSWAVFVQARDLAADIAAVAR